ncbi:hypothetical protein KUTeg_023447 [Tegillarca granosa]|uniref:Uncharacterized protein n=1 Tax=Tegillarca granosa TaxID=220873 RepID=A0ABQ9E687_TEGGR|nr:hypothetical protein KUTeg_023447 [Tegillarca granosa]
MSAAIANINNLLAAKMPRKKKKPGPKARVVGMLLYLLPEGGDLPKLTRMDPLIQVHQDKGFGYPSICYNNNLTARRYPMDINLKGEAMKATIRSLYGTTLNDKDFELFTVSNDKKLSPAPFCARHFRENRYKGRIIIMIKKNPNVLCVNNSAPFTITATDMHQSDYSVFQPDPATECNQHYFDSEILPVVKIETDGEEFDSEVLQTPEHHY